VKAFIDFKGLGKFGVVAVSFPDFGQKPAKQSFGGDHIMYCIFY